MSLATELAPGTVVGGEYRIVELRGAGGMGAVYVAEQLSTGRRRALKVMHHRLAEDDKQHERFVREAKVGALIDSAHVVDVIGAGIEPNGAAWIAMELLDGEDLLSYLATHGPLAPGELLEMYEQLCHALGKAHAAAVVHRDIKPENIFVTKPREARGRPLVKVLDFGIAKLAAGAPSTATMAVGTPAWMAPEQADTAAAIAPATDVWALGLLAFWLLTGRSYWKSWSGGNTSVHAMMKEILFDALPLASKRAAELGVAERLPAGFDDWFDRCVHREPRARFASARQLVEALRVVADAGPASKRPAVPAEGDSEVDAEAMSTRAFLSELESEPGTPVGAAELAEAPAEGEGAGSGATSTTGDPSVVDSAPAGRGRGRKRVAFAAFGAAVAIVAWWAIVRPGPDAQMGSPTSPGAVDGGVASLPPSGEPASGSSGGLAAEHTAPPDGTASAGGASERPQASAHRPGTAAPASPSHRASAVSLASAVPTTAATATQAASTDAASSAAPPTLPPFDRRSAERALAFKVQHVSRACQRGGDAVALSGKVSIGPSGRVTSVDIGDYRVRYTAEGNCATSLLRTLIVQPYDGGAEVLPFAVMIN